MNSTQLSVVCHFEDVFWRFLTSIKLFFPFIKGKMIYAATSIVVECVTTLGLAYYIQFKQSRWLLHSLMFLFHMLCTFALLFTIRYKNSSFRTIARHRPDLATSRSVIMKVVKMQCKASRHNLSWKILFFVSCICCNKFLSKVYFI